MGVLASAALDDAFFNRERFGIQRFVEHVSRARVNGIARGDPPVSNLSRPQYDQHNLQETEDFFRTLS
jgi:hypothetical protein